MREESQHHIISAIVLLYFCMKINIYVVSVLVTRTYEFASANPFSFLLFSY